MRKITFQLNLLFLALLALTLQSCFFVVGAAAGAAAVAIVYDHRNVESILEDQRISREVLHRIHEDPELNDNTHINITSFGQVVLLTGEAPSPDLRQKAEELTRSVRGVIRVYNAITIQGPTSSLTHASDAWISTKIKTELLATKGLKSASIKVVTENGTVYLMGTVTHEQEAIILNIARHANGVQKVVKIFQYKENEAEAEENASPAGAPKAMATNSTAGGGSSSAIPQGIGTDDSQPLISS